MLGRYLKSPDHTGYAEAIRDLRVAANDKSPIKGFTHSIYNYPACLPPQLTRQIIHTFSRPGDTVFDPFVGGGTSAVEALAKGRDFIGTDLNDLAIFVSKLKTLTLRSEDVVVLDQWIEKVDDLIREPHSVDLSDPNFFSVFKGLSPELINAVVGIKESVDTLKTARAQHFAKGVLIRAARITIDNRQRKPSKFRLRNLIHQSYESMLLALLKFQSLRSMRGFGGDCRLIKCDMAFASTADRLEQYNKKINLVLTSPPYPGISVLYNRWQVRGRLEIALPYWIIGSKQVCLPASHFTMGHPKTATGLESYFRTIRESFGNVRAICSRGTLAVVVVAFSERRSQFSLYLDAMSDAGFSEIKNLSNRHFDGRLWREVPNRRWYNNIGRDKAASRKEAILFFRVR